MRRRALMRTISKRIGCAYLVPVTFPGKRRPLLSRLGSKWVSALVGLVLGGLGAAFVIRALVRDWDRIADALSGGDPVWLAAALALGLVSMTGIGLGWKRALGLVGVPSTLGSALRWYFVGQLGKYVPGGIWPVLGRGELAAAGGASRARSYGAVFLSLGATYLAAVLTILTLLPLEPAVARRVPLALWVTALVPVGFGLVHPRVLRWLLARLRRLSARPVELDVPGWGASVALVAAHLPSWLGIGATTWCVARSLHASASFTDLALAAVLAWVVGFLAVPVPGGVGVREAVFTLAAGSLGGGMAAAVAVVSRVVFMVVDVLGAGLSLSGRSRPSPGEPPSARRSGS